jgi:ATP-dependent DNA helicase RecG
MTPTEIRDRISRGEDDTTELKRWAAFPDRVAIAVCALANSAGGLLLLGVDDDGTPSGVPDPPEDVQERITSLLQSGLNAPVPARTGFERLDGRVVHWISVRRYRGPEPLRCKGRPYVRRGRASVEPSPPELQDLYNLFGFILTEEQLVPGSGERDVDEEAFRRFLEKQGLDLTTDPQPDLGTELRNRSISGVEDGEPRLTLYGVLCFGRQPQRFSVTQNAWVELVAYAGAERADEVILRGEAKGRADEQVERAIGWTKALGVHETYEGPHRKDVPLVPDRALREAVVNAVAHRDYAVLGSKSFVEVFTDRVDITSPGVLPNHITEAAALAGGNPRARNQLIANFLSVARLMEQRGRGLPIVRREMNQFNGTEPRLVSSSDGGFVRLTLWRRRA